MKGAWSFVVLVALVVVAVEVLASATGMDPQSALLGALVVAAVAIVWAVRAMGATVSAAPIWPAPLPDEDVSTDWQVAALRSRITYGSGDAEASERLHATLVRIIDDRLRTEHGIDRRSQPEAARAVLGDELLAFADEPTGSRRSGRRRDLERIVTLIETT
jgi:hypothetical protein